MFSPLAGIRVLDFTTSLAGPYCTLVLGALGADVVKIEHPERGDDTRTWGPPFWGSESATYLAANASKRSLGVDAKQPAGLEILLRLAERSEIFVQNMRPGLAERIGLGFEALKERSPRIVYCSISAFGTVGPLREQLGYDPLVQAAGGIMSVTGETGRQPVRAGVSLVDQGTGLWAVIAVLAALRARDQGAGAQLIDLSLYETGVNWLPYQIAGYLGSGKVPRGMGTALGIIAPYQTFEAADGWLMIAAGNDRQFASLCQVLGTPGLADDERFATNPDRVAHREELATIIAERVRPETRTTWLERLGGAGVPAAPVQDLAEVVAHEQTAALGLLQELPHPAIGDLRLVALPIAVDGERAAHRSCPPSLGEHTAEILAELGYGPAEIDRLREQRIVRAGQAPD